MTVAVDNALPSELLYSIDARIELLFTSAQGSLEVQAEAPGPFPPGPVPPATRPALAYPASPPALRQWRDLLTMPQLIQSETVTLALSSANGTNEAGNVFVFQIPVLRGHRTELLWWLKPVAEYGSRLTVRLSEEFLVDPTDQPTPSIGRSGAQTVM